MNVTMESGGTWNLAISVPNFFLSKWMPENKNDESLAIGIGSKQSCSFPPIPIRGFGCSVLFASFAAARDLHTVRLDSLFKQGYVDAFHFICLCWTLLFRSVPCWAFGFLVLVLGLENQLTRNENKMVSFLFYFLIETHLFHFIQNNRSNTGWNKIKNLATSITSRRSSKRMSDLISLPPMKLTP